MLQFNDSAFPVGTFSFSNGLETAVHQGIVKDAETLEEYTATAALQAAYSDAVIALHSFRAAKNNDFERINEIDRYLFNFRMNDEARLMLKRMGKKMAELSVKIIDCPLMNRWLENIKSNTVPGTFPVAQGILFFATGMTESDLYVSHQFGVINMIVSAALRCVRVSHYDTQKIIFNLSSKIDDWYNSAKDLELEEMYSFVPQMDILASLHEKGNMRMFMN